MDSNLSAGDIMALTKDNDGMANIWNNPFIYLVWLALLGGNGLFGGYGNNTAATAANTTAELQNAITAGNTNQDILRNFNDASTNLSNLRYDMSNGFSGVNANLAENRYAQQNCCCQTQQAIAASQAEAYKNTCEITTAIHSEGEATRALINENTMQNLRDRLADKDRELQTSNFLLSQQAQNQTLIDAIRPTPIPAYVTSSPYTSSYYGSTCSACGV